MLTETLLIFLTSIASYNHATTKPLPQQEKPKVEVQQENTNAQSQLLRGGWDLN